MNIKRIATVVGGLTMANAAANIALRVVNKSGGSVAGVTFMALGTLSDLLTPAPLAYQQLHGPYSADFIRGAATALKKHAAFEEMTSSGV